MNDGLAAAWRRWHFSMGLLATYLVTFAAWQHLEPAMIRLTGISVSVILFGGLVLVSARGYFLNQWDRLIHAVVILDIFVESFLPEHFGFFWCALAFLALIAVYRSILQRRLRPGPAPGQTEPQA